MNKDSRDKTINLAIIAMGGQGGGVLSKWILDLAQANGYLAQTTSVPGVAQRTGATIYYIEMFPKYLAEQQGQTPVFALTPVPGNVDITIASELMETGRALQRGLISEQTTLIYSTHRDYAITEKQMMGDGRSQLAEIQELACNTAAKTIFFNMKKTAQESGAVISSVLFGTLARSESLPFPRAAFEQIIRDTGRSVTVNLSGFANGFDQAVAGIESNSNALPQRITFVPPASKIAPLLARMDTEFPRESHVMILAGLKKLVDYQDPEYADLYLDRLKKITKLDNKYDGKKKDWQITRNMARYLALAMSYEDISRVADLKIRVSRFDRIRKEANAKPGQIVQVSEYLHPRLQEFCDVLPAELGAFVLRMKFLHRFFRKGRRVTTTSLHGYLTFTFLSTFRHQRRKSLRFRVETTRINTWLTQVQTEIPGDYDLSCELAGLQRLLKGYGDTYERGLANVAQIMSVYPRLQKQKNAASCLKALKKAALQDEEGTTLRQALLEFSN